ncbi:MAG TPA: glycosyltransferase family 39 protein, partial [bacterium]|nr:glycosyltransferase family 39 protein [bacterium]
MLIQKIRSDIPLLIILIISIFLRSYKLSTTPPVNSDEAALAYNAFSLLETGKDEHGISWPLHFKSFGDYKPGGYVYLSLPFIKILGLNTLAIRLPNLILSVLSIYFFYKLVSLLSIRTLGFYSTIVLSLSPWHIHFSRGAWESCTALSFTIIAIYLFYSYILNLPRQRRGRKTYFYLYLSILFFSLSLYTYHSARLITPLIIIFLFVQNFKTL